MHNGRLFLLGALAVTGLMFGSNPAHGQAAGTLNKAFGKSGTVTTSLCTNCTVSPVTAIQEANGDFAVVTGVMSYSTFTEDFALVRYTSAGKLLGITQTAFFPAGFNIPVALAVQPNGDILVAGSAAPSIDGAMQFAMARYTPAGVLDTTFGTKGLVMSGVNGPFPSPSALLLQPNGQILVAGFIDGSNNNASGSTVLVRYNTNGALDTTFGTAGVVETPSNAAQPGALAELSNGSYLAVGGATPSVVEFSPTGVLQSAVTPGTVVATSISGSSFGIGNPVVFLSSGEYVVAKTEALGHNKSNVIAERFSQAGVLDTTFSSPLFTFGSSTQAEPSALAVQSNGQVLVGGAGLAQLNANGTVNTAFGTNGSLQFTYAVTGILPLSTGDFISVAGSPVTNIATDPQNSLTLSEYFSN